MCIFKVLEANRVRLIYGTQAFLGVLKGAESKSLVCPAQKCPMTSRDPERSTSSDPSYASSPNIAKTAGDAI